MAFAGVPPGAPAYGGRRGNGGGLPDENSMAASTASFLDAFDFSVIEEMDPSLAEGHRVLYDKDVPFELRVQDAELGEREVGTMEVIRCKILALGDEHTPQHCRIELTSENDLFFHYTHSVDEHNFQAMQEHQKLMIDFPGYMSVLQKNLNNVIQEAECYLAVFVMQRDGHARLDFIQNMEYKFVELLSCDFLASSEEVVRQQITFRYNSMKSRLESRQARMQSKLQDIGALLKVKNPSLYRQFFGPTPAGNGLRR